MTTTEIAIRPAIDADLPVALRLLTAQFTDHAIDLAPEVLAATVRGILARPSVGRVLVAAAGDEIVGVAVLTFMWSLEHGGPAAWLEELWVEPPWRRRGIGARMVEAAMATARAEGAAAVDLEVEAEHDAAERLYARLGFRRHRRTHWVRSLATPRGPGASARPFPSIDHLSLGVNDLTRSKAFYDAALAPLGLVPHEEIPGEVAYGPPTERPADGWAFYIGFEDPAAKRPVAPSAGLHIAFNAPTRAVVRAFHAAALAAGGRDLGAPGPRPHYGAHYYGAFVADPDGHHVEAVCHAADPEA